MASNFYKDFQAKSFIVFNDDIVKDYTHSHYY